MSEPCEFCGQEPGPEHERDVAPFGVPMTVKTCPNIPQGWLAVVDSEGDMRVAEHEGVDDDSEADR